MGKRDKRIPHHPYNPMSIVVCGDGSMYNSQDHILLFQQINLAKCAMERAQDLNLSTAEGGDRFKREFGTARLWARRGNRCAV
jgi:hypothetical protein